MSKYSCSKANTGCKYTGKKSQKAPSSRSRVATASDLFEVTMAQSERIKKLEAELKKLRSACKAPRSSRR
jgi:hypothetical protein